MPNVKCAECDKPSNDTECMGCNKYLCDECAKYDDGWDICDDCCGMGWGKCDDCDCATDTACEECGIPFCARCYDDKLATGIILCHKCNR